MTQRRLVHSIVLVLGLVLFVVWSRPVAAHVELKEAVPPPGAELDKSPPEIRLTFSGPVDARSTFVLFGSGFQQIPGIVPRRDSESPDQLWAAIPLLAPGDYTVQWDVLSQDGHPASGSYAFAIQAPAGNGRSLTRLFIPGILALLALGLLAFAVRRQRQAMIR